MGKIGQMFDRWLGRASGLYTFWTLAPAGTIAVVSAYLSTGVGWIAALGPFGWFSAGLIGFFLSSVGFAVISRTKLWRLEAKRQARLIGGGSAFDPMARVYENKRLYLSDLAPLGRDHVNNKKFVNCEIIGPGNIVVSLKAPGDLHFPQFTKNIYHDVDFIQIEQGKTTRNAIYFAGCDFDGCHFYALNLLFYDRASWGEEAPWITPPSQQLQFESLNEKPPTGEV